MKKNKILFFDRDGILINTKRINNRPIAINNIKNIKFCYGIKKIIKLSRENNYINIMVTNQPDISRKKINKKKVDNINEYIKKKLSLDDVFMCGHDDKDYCDCRKPKTGMLIKAKKKWFGDFKKSIIIGDRWKDISCGKKAKINTILIKYIYDEKKIFGNYNFNSIYQLSKNINKILKKYE